MRTSIKPNLPPDASENLIVEQFGMRGYVRAFKAATLSAAVPNGRFVPVILTQNR